MAACRRAAVSCNLVGPPAGFLRSAAAFPEPTVPPPASAPQNPPPAKRLTENASPTFASSGDPCLDFFFHVVPGTPAARVTSLLADAWAAEPLTALCLACNLLGVRGTGKSDREGFYAAALWMHECHPVTLALNAPSIVQFGYLKVLPEILHRIVIKGVSNTSTPGKMAEVRRTGAALGFLRLDKKECAAAFKELERKIERRWRAEAAARAVERYARDANYRFLHDCTADMFADLLAGDLRKLADGKVNEISLAGKWCPSLNCRHDRSTLMCEAIARRLFPEGSAPDLPEDMADEHYVYQVRNRLRKALASLRRALELPEIFVTAQAWGQVVYPRVASRAMRKYRELFLKHDGERFEFYLADVEAGKAKIAAGALLPHEILASVSVGGGGVADLQWERMVSDLRELGKLSNCIAICDVSGSMTGLPMDVCVALGLLVSELGDEPWRHRLITFSERPELHLITGEDLWEKTIFIRRMHWMLNTDFQAVFDKILSVAVAGNLPPERMVRKVFVFSDMEFDQASSRPWETDYEAITRKFTEAGYGAVVPDIVFWNLRDSMSVPVTAGQKGVAMVSGFSKNFVKLFLDNDGIISPRAIMEKAISGPEYRKLVVFD
ncbi:unnamed protein product [Urochloa decumbens]|uniref:Uncharacterized protein n=1 Tax=Urochloa decumbens TaxID=240449 RepID=A0ABC9E8G0_9POAL